MQRDVLRDVKFLKFFALAMTLAWVVTVVAAFGPGKGKQRFEEIDVERINIVEQDGQIKMVLSNKNRFPDPGNVLTGQHQKRVGMRTPGMVFYNDAGDECGGLIFGSKDENGKYAAGSFLGFDKYHGDQVMGIQFEEGEGKRVVGFRVWDQPELSGNQRQARAAEARKMDPGPARDAAMQEVSAAQRVFVGRGLDKAAGITLSDGNGRPRIRLVSPQNGEPKLEFLDAQGKVVQTLPATGPAGN